MPVSEVDRSVFTFQKIYNYLYGDHAEIRQDPKRSEEQQAAYKKKRLEIIKKDFSFLTIKPSDKSLFRQFLRKARAESLEEAIFGNNKDDLKLDNTSYLEEKILSSFHRLNNEYHYFKEKDYERFKKIYLVLEFYYTFIELNRNVDSSQIFLEAYKILALFADSDDNKIFSKLDNYLNIHNFTKKSQPLQKALKYDIIPLEETKDIEKWKILIHKSGNRAFKLLKEAGRIENILGKIPQTIQEAENGALLLHYRNAKKNLELARLCEAYNVKESAFDQCLILDSRRVKNNLPATHIDGRDIGLDGYALVKLPENDPRRFLLGEIVKECQSIGKLGHQCALDGSTLENNGFYVLLKIKDKSQNSTSKIFNNDGTLNYSNYEIIGQGYAWLTIAGNLTFDSWENVRPADDVVSEKMLDQFAKKVVKDDHSTILRVTIGTGGKTPQKYKASPPITDSEGMIEGTQYKDSYEQSSIYRNDDKITELRQKTASILYSLDKHYLDEDAIQLFANNIVGYKEFENLIYFFDNGSNDIVSNLTKEDISSLKKMVQAHDPYTWALCSSLINSKANLKYVDFIRIINACVSNKALTEVFFKINSIGFLNNELINILIANPSQAQSIGNLYLKLFSEKVLDNLDMSDVKGNPQYAELVLKAISKLQQAGLINRRYCEFIFMNSEYAIDIADSFIKLQKENILNHDTEEVILTNPQFSWNLADSLVRLHKHSLLTPEYVSLVLEKPESVDVSKGIVNLKKHGMLNSTILNILKEFPGSLILINKMINNLKPRDIPMSQFPVFIQKFFEVLPYLQKIPDESLLLRNDIVNSITDIILLGIKNNSKIESLKLFPFDHISNHEQLVKEIKKHLPYERNEWKILQSIWDNAGSDRYRQTRALLYYYTKSDSILPAALNRFFRGSWNRSHTKEIESILNNSDIKTYKQLVERLDQVQLLNDVGLLGLIKDFVKIKENVQDPTISESKTR